MEIPIRAAKDLNVLLVLPGVVGRGGTEVVDVVVVVDEVGERGVVGFEAALHCICIMDVRVEGGTVVEASILMSGLVG